jgi:hypothetical protein
VVILSFLVYKLFFSYQLNKLVVEYNWQFTYQNICMLAIALVLMGANWWLEVVKWKILANKLEPTSSSDALKGVLAGVTLNIITPNQLGEFIGKLLYLKSTPKLKGALSAIIGNTAQVIMTLLFGLMGLFYIMLNTHLLNMQQFIWLNIFLSVALIVVVFIYFNINKIAQFKWLSGVKKHLVVFTQYTSSELGVLLILSLIRYLVFALQYYLLTNVFFIDVSFAQAVACIFAAMCVQSFMPSFMLIELGMRGAAALWFFSLFTNQVVSILLTTYVLWIINVMLPGLIGLFFVLKWRSNRA